MGGSSRVMRSATWPLALLGAGAALALAAASPALPPRTLAVLLLAPAAAGLCLWLLLSVRRAALFFLLVMPLGNITLLPLVSPLKLAFAVALGALALRMALFAEEIRLPKMILFWGGGWCMAALLSLATNPWTPSTTFQLLQLTSSIAIALLVPVLYPTLADLRAAVRWLWWPGLLFTVLALGDLARDEARIAGIWGNANMASLYIGFFGPLGVYGYLTARPGRRWLYLFGLLVVVFAFIMSGSRSGYLTLPLVALIFAMTLAPVRRLFLWGVPALMVISLLLVPRFGSFMDELAGRSYVSKHSGEFKIDLSTGARILDVLAGSGMIADHPLLGVGIGNYSRNFTAYIPAEMRRGEWANYVVQAGDLSSHNLLILVAAEMGAAGTIFFMGFLLLVPIYFLRAWRLLPRGPDRVLLVCFIVSAAGTLLSGSLHGGFAYRHFIGWFVGVAYVFWRESRAAREARA